MKPKQERIPEPERSKIIAALEAHYVEKDKPKSRRLCLELANSKDGAIEHALRFFGAGPYVEDLNALIAHYRALP